MLISTALIAAAQQAFDVASIKPHPRNNFNVSFNRPTPGRIAIGGYSLQALVSEAYQIDYNDIVGGPAWVREERYDVEAQVDGMTESIADERMRPLLQRLLADRFGLKTHAETREMSVYLLLQDSKGHKMKVHDSGQPSGMSLLGPNGTAKLTVKGYSMPKVATLFLSVSRLRTVDATSLTGEYDFTLEWTDNLRSEEGVSFTTAIQEQLGLRLEQRKMPVEVYVIDAAKRPSEN